MKVSVDPDAAAKAQAAAAVWLNDEFGPQVVRRAKAYCPVDTGALRESVGQEMDGTTLIVSAVGGRDGRSYAAYVELGHRVFHSFTRVVGPEWVVARPFLRPAIYYGFWAGPIGIFVPEKPVELWRPEFGFGGDVRGPAGDTAQPRQP